MDKKKIAIIDDDFEWMDNIKDLYEMNYGCEVDVFEYSNMSNVQTIYDIADDYDYILIDHRLGDANGASIAKNLLSEVEKAKIIIISGYYEDNYEKFTYYINKVDLASNPALIFDIQSDFICQVTETECLLHMKGNGNGRRSE